MTDSVLVDTLATGNTGQGVFGPEIFIIIIIFVSVMIIGFVKLYREVNKLDKNVEFTTNFLEKFFRFVESNGNDNEAYVWLVNRSPKMQRIMGSFGVMGYRPAFQNYYLRNHQIIINFIPEIRREFNRSFFGDQISFFVDTIQESIMRYAGTLEDRQVVAIKSLKNPLQWINEGIGAILIIPLKILYTFKILSESSIEAIAGNIIFKLFKLLAVVIGFISAIMTITMGWNNFIEFISKTILGT